MWAAYEWIAELTGIISSLSSSPCDRFCASLSEADPTAPFTSAGIYLLLGLLNPSASPENEVYPTVADSALRKLHRLRET